MHACRRSTRPGRFHAFASNIHSTAISMRSTAAAEYHGHSHELSPMYTTSPYPATEKRARAHDWECQREQDEDARGDRGRLAHARRDGGGRYDEMVVLEHAHGELSHRLASRSSRSMTPPRRATGQALVVRRCRVIIGQGRIIKTCVCGQEGERMWVGRCILRSPQQTKDRRRRHGRSARTPIESTHRTAVGVPAGRAAAPPPRTRSRGSPRSGDLVHHVLLVDQVAGPSSLVSRGDVACPVVEERVGRARLPETTPAGRSMRA